MCENMMQQAVQHGRPFSRTTHAFMQAANTTANGQPLAQKSSVKQLRHTVGHHNLDAAVPGLSL